MFILLPLMVGCSVQIQIGSPLVDITGRWSGTWLSRNGVHRGDITFSFIQLGVDLKGTVSLTGSPCFENGKLSGVISGKNIATGAVFENTLRVDFDGTVEDDRIKGSYLVIEGGSCDGDSGIWTAVRG